MKIQLITFNIPIIVCDEKPRVGDYYTPIDFSYIEQYSNDDDYEITTASKLLKVIAGLTKLPQINYNGLEKEFEFDKPKVFNVEIEMELMDVDYARILFRDHTEHQHHFHYYSSGMVSYKKNYQHLYLIPKVRNNTIKILRKI